MIKLFQNNLSRNIQHPDTEVNRSTPKDLKIVVLQTGSTYTIYVLQWQFNAVGRTYGYEACGDLAAPQSCIRLLFWPSLCLQIF